MGTNDKQNTSVGGSDAPTCHKVPTPETDEWVRSHWGRHSALHDSREFMQKLETERDEARVFARDWREQWSLAVKVTNPPEHQFPFPWEPQITKNILARCEQRAIEIYYSAPPDKLAGECRAELENEFGEKVVAEMLRIGIGNNKIQPQNR
jgi:hypothetical protein